VTDDKLIAEVVPKWQPIETAPRDGTSVLLFADDRGDYGRGEPYQGQWDAEHEMWRTFCGDDVESERHGPHWWIPMPAPPPDEVLQAAEQAYSEARRAAWEKAAGSVEIRYAPPGRPKSIPPTRSPTP